MKAKVINVYDGDTATVAVKWLDITKTCRVRFASINTSELNSKDPTELAKAVLAQQRLAGLLPIGSSIIIQSHIVDKFGRILGTIYLSQNDTVSVNDMMVNEGLAKRVNLSAQIREIEVDLLKPMK